ncbi:MAG: tetratricopeptide repeat protein, partial [Pseudomonadota bacterium]
AWQALASAWMTLPTYSDEVDPNQAFAEALYAADRALKLDDSLVEANSVMAAVAKMRGDWIEARRIYDEAIAKAPDNTMLMLWRAEVYRDLGFIKENRAQLETALARDPNSPPIQIALAMNQHITDDFEAGQETLLYLWNEQGIKTPVSWFGIWHIHVRQGEYDAAEAWLDNSPLPIDTDLLSDFL